MNQLVACGSSGQTVGIGLALALDKHLDTMSDKLISTLGEILKNVPCYLMECNISPDAAYTAYKTVFGDNSTH